MSANINSPHHGGDVSSVACAIVTVSDTRTPDNDASGEAISELLTTAGHRVVSKEILPDEAHLVEIEIKRLADDPSVSAVVLTGGTGLSARDTTYEAVSGLFSKRIDGFGELFRMLSYQEVGAAAMLTRAVAGLVGHTAVFALPGSTAACTLGVKSLILPELGHLVTLAETEV